MDKKTERVLNIYNRLLDGEMINKTEEAQRFCVDARTIQRDIEDIRMYFASNYESERELIYDRTMNRYLLVHNQTGCLTNAEVMTICKILLESRSLKREEMYRIIDKLIVCSSPMENKDKLKKLISNEKYHYLELHHKSALIEKIWSIGNAVYENRLMKIRYKKLKQTNQVMRMIQPVGIMFSEYYFYLTAYMCESEENPDIPKRPFPTIYRIDRIEEYEILEQRFQIPYRDRFEEGEFRKRVQFMFGGELKTIHFRYKGLSIEAVLDRLPTAQVINHDENGWEISAEVYGEGIDMWIRSQGNYIELI